MEIKIVGKLPKLTKEQTRVLDEIIFGAAIELDENNDPYNYHLVFPDDTYESVRADTVHRLIDTGLIKKQETEWYEPKRWS